MIVRNIVLMVLVCIFASIIGQASNPLFYKPPLSQHTMCKYVSPDSIPIERTYSFSICDEQAVSWLLFWRDKRMHSVEWRWYSPVKTAKGRVYARTFGVIPPDDGPMGIWNAPIWSCLKIADQDAAYMPGIWRVDVIVDYRKVLTEYFTIDGKGLC